jgi:uncharacterized protein
MNGSSVVHRVAMGAQRKRPSPWLWVIVPWLLCCSTEAQSAPARAERDVAAAKLSATAPSVTFMPVGQPAVTVQVEVVATPEERQRGLMYRKHLEPNAGMLFIFEASQPLTFWMRNTYVPLDMIFVTEDMTVLGIVENATPRTDDPRRVPGFSRYVVEVNAGFSRKHGLSAGTKLSFANLPRTSEVKR